MFIWVSRNGNKARLVGILKESATRMEVGYFERYINSVDDILEVKKTISPDLSDFGSLTLPFRKPSRICRIEERGGGAIWLLMQFPKGLETGACLQPPLLEMHLDQNGSRQKLKADKAGIAVATINLEIH